MLRSTHRTVPDLPPLPEGWTEHTAPTGHSYYYHATTKTSTYTRPTAPIVTPTQHAPPFQLSENSYSAGQAQFNGAFGQQASIAPTNFQGHGKNRYGPDAFRQNSRPEPKDRPKSKQVIPGCSPWLLVKTKLGRRFVYNPEVEESYWKFPSDVLKCVVELDRKERERRERRERGEPSQSEEEDEPEVAKAEKGYDSEEYEEVEITDDEYEDNASKKLKIDEDQPQGPVEFNEDDIAYQLAAMGQDREEDFDEEQGDLHDDFEEPPLNEDDSKALFTDLLDDFRINPYTPWEKIIEDGAIIDDSRYTCLPNMKSRREVFDVWSRARMQQLKEQREKQEKKDPRIAYFAFLEKHATPKLYWPEFKRKYKKEPEMRDAKLSDRDREKAYREHITRFKLPLQTLKSDLRALLSSQPVSALNRSTSLSALPTAVLTDLRYISLRPSERDPLIEAYITLQPAAPELSDASAEEVAEAQRLKEEREKREEALREREKKVEEEKRRREGRERVSKRNLKEGEEEVRRAMKVGRQGLLGHFQEGEEKAAGGGNGDEDAKMKEE